MIHTGNNKASVFWGQVTCCEPNATYYFKMEYMKTHVQVHTVQKWIKLK